MIKTHLKMIFTKPIYYLSIIFVFATVIIRLLYLNDSEDVVSAVDIMLDLDGMRKIILIFAAVPFNAQFCNEYNSKMHHFFISRSSKKEYSISHVVNTVISSFTVTFLGLVLFIIVLSFYKTFYIFYPDDPYHFAFGSLLAHNKPILYILAKISIYAISNSFWCMLGLILSVFTRNAYVAICGPFIFSYILEKLVLNFPDKINLYYLSLGRVQLGINTAIDYLYAILFFILLIIICGIVFYKQMKRVIENE